MFARNFGVRYGPLSITESNRTTVSNCVFYDNSAGELGTGGAITLKNILTLILSYSSFFNNKALRGGAIAVIDTQMLMISSCTFMRNHVEPGRAVGGDVVLKNVLDAVMDNNSFTSSYSGYDGGSICAIQVRRLQIRGENVFKNCSCTFRGGCVALYAVTYASIIGSVFLSIIHI